MEDVLYYSTNCPHCQRLLEYLARNGITNKFNFLSIDRRMRDPSTGQILLILDRGTKVSLPPNIHNVPSLMLPKQSYRVLIGNDIYTYLESMVNKITNEVTRNNGEPSGFLLGSGQNMSEQFTYYNMTPEELGAKGKGPMRQLLNYVPATHETGNQHIEALPDNYKTDRLKEGDVNMESLEQRRNMEIAPLQQNGPLAGINANHMLPPPHPQQQQAPPSMMPSTSSASASGPGFFSTTTTTTNCSHVWNVHIWFVPTTTVFFFSTTSTTHVFQLCGSNQSIYASTTPFHDGQQESYVSIQTAIPTPAYSLFGEHLKKKGDGRKKNNKNKLKKQIFKTST